MITNIRQIGDSKLLCLHFSDSVTDEIMAIDFEFDCFLVNRDADIIVEESRFIDALAIRTTDWIEVFGFNAEQLHDAIDVASVRLKRQQAVGDGSPMTAWHDDIRTNAEIVSYITTGGLGYAEKKILLVVGNDADERSIVKELARSQR